MTTSSTKKIALLQSQITALEKELATHREYQKDRLVTEIMLFITGAVVGAVGVFYGL